MKTKLVTALVIFTILVLSAIPSLAARNITLPYEMKFDSGSITDLVWIKNGGTVTQISSGGWSGGYVKTTPPTSAPGGDGEYNALGYFYFSPVARLNIRFLMKVGTTYYSSLIGRINKFIDVWGTSNRYGIMGFNATYDGTFVTPGVWTSDYSAYYFNNNPDYAASREPYGLFRVSNAANHGGEWICYEYEINSTEGTTTITVTEADGTVTTIGPVTGRMPGTAMTNFLIGGYYNAHSVNNVNNYLSLDELKISNTRIGPPDGFVGGGILPPNNFRKTSP